MAVIERSLSGSAVYAIYRTFEQTVPRSWNRCCSQLGVISAEFEELLEIYNRNDTEDWSKPHLALLSWFCVQVSRNSNIAIADLELKISENLNDLGYSGKKLILPGGVPCLYSPHPFNSRFPAFPLYCEDIELCKALDGLLYHFALRPFLQENHISELSLSAIVWRIGTILERVFPEGQGPSQYVRFSQMPRILARDQFLTLQDKSLCKSFPLDLGDRRNVLTHLTTSSPFPSFSEVVNKLGEDGDDVWRWAAVVNLFVIIQLADTFLQTNSAISWLHAIRRDMRWR